MATHSSILAWTIPMDRGVWRATVHEITKSWTRIIDVHSLTHVLLCDLFKCMRMDLLLQISCFSLVKVKVKLCPTFCDPMDCSPTGSSVHGIFQA